MRSSAALGMNGPTSLTISRAIGAWGKDASVMPMMPPIDVPNQSTAGTPRRAISAAQAAT